MYIIITASSSTASTQSVNHRITFWHSLLITACCSNALEKHLTSSNTCDRYQNPYHRLACSVGNNRQTRLKPVILHISDGAHPREVNQRNNKLLNINENASDVLAFATTRKNTTTRSHNPLLASMCTLNNQWMTILLHAKRRLLRPRHGCAKCLCSERQSTCLFNNSLIDWKRRAIDLNYILRMRVSKRQLRRGNFIPFQGRS